MVGDLSDRYFHHGLADLLATHSLVFLALGILTALSSVVAIVVTSHVLGRLWEFSLQRLMRNQRITARSISIVAFMPMALGLSLAFTATTSVFVILAEEVITGGRIARFDVLFANALRSIVTPGWERFFSAVSYIGSTDVMIVVTLLIACVLLLNRHHSLAAGWLFAQLGGALLISILKLTFVRARPESAPLEEATWSFPSGHVMGTVVFVGVGCYLLLRQTHSSVLAIVVLTLALAWSLLVSFSRLNLGVHFASDVVAGVFAGGAWVSVCIAAFELARSGRTIIVRDEPRQGPVRKTAA